MAPIPAQAAIDWEINHFHTEIALEADGSLSVVEQIQVNFNVARHGIYRDLPYLYNSSGQEIATEINDIKVTRDNQTEITNLEQNQSYLRIRIGDPAQTVTGQQLYRVEYSVLGALRSFQDYDEIYWNTTGNNWDVPIRSASASVRLPEDGIVTLACYEGITGSVNPCVTETVDPQTANFSNTNELGNQTGMTILVDYRKGMVPITVVTPRRVQFQKGLTSWPVTGLYLIPFIFAAFWYWLWRRIGRDLGDRHRSIAPEYEVPLKLKPAEIGTILDEQADNRDLSATIVDLAIKGYLTITELKGGKSTPLTGLRKLLSFLRDYELTPTSKNRNKLDPFEQELLQGLFEDQTSVRLKSLPPNFATTLTKTKKLVYEQVTQKGAFQTNPNTIRIRYLCFSIIPLMGSVPCLMIGYENIASLFALGLVLVACGLIVLISAHSMAQRTSKGTMLLHQIQGYKLFICNVEKYRQPFFEREGYFMEVLPYAMIFGVANKLAKDFESMGIAVQKPDWFIGQQFSPLLFANTMAQLSSTLTNSVSSVSSGGGGGSAGGGFGGGGGGSW